jgi:hypothetical protein
MGKKKQGGGIRFADSREVKGWLSYTVYKNGAPIEAVQEKNLIVNGARNQTARLIAGGAEGSPITQISFGTRGDGPVPEDTEITNGYTKNISGYSFPAAGQARFERGLTINERNGMAIPESGLITGGGALFSRRARENQNPIRKESGISIEGYWAIIF